MSPRVQLTHDPIALDPLLAHVAQASAGGIATFVGVVRDHADGRAVTLLEYEAYAPMAVAEMERIVAEIEAAFAGDGVRIAVAHRIGPLRVGDVAVICAASAPHRGEAFTACRRLIDEIKARVPIWKREHGPEGAYWVGWRDARCEADHGHASAHPHDHDPDHDHEPKP